MASRLLKPLFVVSLLALSLPGPARTGGRLPPQPPTLPQPGAGIPVQPVIGNQPGERFQTKLVMQALRDLGYSVQPSVIMGYAEAHRAVASGKGTFLANHWTALHGEFYEKAGGDERLVRKRAYSTSTLQGYVIDKQSARKYDIRDISQLKDPKIAQLFDIDGDGRADLVGCRHGWGCAEAINHHLRSYGLGRTVRHKQDDYELMVGRVLERFSEGKPLLYYTWSPHWLGDVLVPGKDVTWLQVPFSAVKGRPRADTSLPDGSNFGFESNRQKIVVTRNWAEANSAAERLFEVMELPSEDISRQNVRMHRGENSIADIERHVSEWILKNRRVYDGWLDQARAAGRRQT